MLILTRRVGENITIGDDIVVTILGVKGNQVRVGINAPRDVEVHRDEVYERIQREERGAPVPFVGSPVQTPTGVPAVFKRRRAMPA